MIKYDKALLGTDGITSTSADHLCNIGKEWVRGINAELTSMSFVDSHVIIPGVPTALLIRGTNTVEHVDEQIGKIAEINAFIAWMREAIRAKESAIEEVKKSALRKWMEEQGHDVIELPAWKPGDMMTISDAIAELSIKERARYYMLEAQASTLGKLIHPHGAIHDARQRMFDAIRNPSTVKDNKIYTNEVSIDEAEVDTLYFALQKKHREIEASLNAIKGSLDHKVEEHNLAVSRKYKEECDKASAELATWNAKFSEWQKEQVKELRKLKIVIPETLKETYDFLSNL